MLDRNIGHAVVKLTCMSLGVEPTFRRVSHLGPGEKDPCFPRSNRTVGMAAMPSPLLGGLRSVALAGARPG